MMDNDSKKSSCGQHWIHWAVGPLIDTLLDIVRKEIVKNTILLLKKHVRHRMTF